MRISAAAIALGLLACHQGAEEFPVARRLAARAHLVDHAVGAVRLPDAVSGAPPGRPRARPQLSARSRTLTLLRS